MEFEAFVARASGHAPYPYQRRIAAEGLPEVLVVPTGAGKTAAAVLGWLWRRREHPDPAVRRATPRWLVLAMPMRVLVEQAAGEVERWLANLELAGEVGAYTLMGGESRRGSRWRYEPERDAVFVGTLDMFLSRALNRGYGESRWVWPVDFGLFNAGTHWVFDEVQLMGPALPTSRQLDAFRRAMGAAAPARTTWMSATVDATLLATVDNRDVGPTIELGDDDRVGPLARRLDAAKSVGELVVDPKRYAPELAAAVAQRHRPGSRTILVVNTVDRAADLHRELAKVAPDAERVLVHSRFRPPDRRRVVERATAPVDPSGPGLIVVSTQVLEAGVDVSARTLVTEVAPWPSVVQRAGRCNRDGSEDGADLWWVDPPKPLPYKPGDLARAREALADLTLAATPASPAALQRVEVKDEAPIHPVLRRRDLIDLFDTLPDLSGNDVDVSRFIRDTDDLDAPVAWRPVEADSALGRTALPARDERCPVPVAALRDFLRARGPAVVAWRYDHLAARWVPCRAADVRPGQVVTVAPEAGGYLPETGWSPRSSTRVEPVDAGGVPAAAAPEADADLAVGDDPVTFTRQWVGLDRHLTDVEREVTALARALGERLDLGLPPRLVDAAVAAGQWHDLGKAHAVFQRTLAATAEGDTEQAAARAEPQPWAKSGGSGRARHKRRHFRHELASALALLAERSPLDGHPERDLVTYLVAAHHGRVRLGIRTLPGEDRPGNATTTFALGVWDGDPLPEVTVGGDVVAARELRLDVMRLGRSASGEPSWGERALALRDRDDLGPFRLAFLEALVRVADWRVSARYDRPGASPT